jgi:hypothetical protein
VHNHEALILTGGQVKAVKLREAKVNSIACQTIDEYDVIPLKCSTTLLDFDAKNQYVACPKDCKHDPTPLHGNGLFSEDSSVCKAVAMTGNYIENEDFYYAAITSNKQLVNKFESGKGHTISSTFKKGQSFAFAVSKFSDFLHQCPAEKALQMTKAKSFMQTATHVKTNNLQLNNIRTNYH